MEANWSKDLARLLVSEGGKVDNPKDPGGRTNKGITQRVYTAWLRNQGRPSQDVYNITPDEVSAIYKAQYWDRIKGDILPTGIDYVTLDGAANSGDMQSVKWLQHGLQLDNVDGIIGQATIAAVTSPDLDCDAVIGRMLDARLAFCEHLKTWKTFGHGWESRIDHVKQVGQLEAAGSVGPEPLYFEGAENKADIADAKPVPPIATASALTSGGSVATGLSGLLATLQPFGAISPTLTADLGYAAAGLSVLTFIAGYWLVWVKKRAAERAAALDLPTGVGSPVPATP